MWKIPKGLLISEISDDVFLFQFPNDLERRKVLPNGPWSFDKVMLVLNVVDSLLRPSDYKFNKCSFWVRFYNLPFACMSQECGCILRERAGKVEEVYGGPGGDCVRKFLRVRISIDLSKSLSRGVKLCIAEGVDPIWIPVKYEQLYDFCYCCGLLDHSYKECLREFRNISPNRNRMFGMGRDSSSSCLGSDSRVETVMEKSKIGKVAAEMVYSGAPS